jgi:class 3 adenylate cyclase/predicted ATPase
MHRGFIARGNMAACPWGYIMMVPSHGTRSGRMSGERRQIDATAIPDIGRWLDGLGLSRYRTLFAEQEISADVLGDLTDGDLQAWGVPFGPRKRIIRAIAALPLLHPPGLATTDVVAQTEPGSGAERRQVTIMFCDMVGSTRLTTALDPEDTREVMRAYRDVCNGAIGMFDGHVVRYFGDGVLACFGWPVAHEDDAERAVRAAIAIVRELRRTHPLPGIAVQVRIGIATGLVVIGDLIGEGASQEPSVVGETPNLAARLQTIAGTDDVVISASTRRLLGSMFQLEEVGPLELKDIPEPVTVWRVSGEAMTESRFAAAHSTQVGALVGREAEMALLLDRWQQAIQGEGQVVLLSGQAGIGKSRLAEALREHIRLEPRSLLRYQCSPYHMNSALYPVITRIERVARIQSEDPPERRLDKLRTLLASVPETSDTAVALLAELLSIPPTPGLAPLELDPPARKQATLELLIDLTSRIVRQQKVLLLLEDAHWIDPTTRELFDRLIARTNDLPVMMLITFRPEFDQPAWAVHPHATPLQLNRLSRHASNLLLDGLSGARALPVEMRESILAKTDGVPLFVEELTKTMLESDLLHDVDGQWTLSGPLPAMAIPTTLQDSLMARLDRMAPVKSIAQIGAVIGREFSYRLIAALVPLEPARLHEALGQLVAAELIYARGAPPDAIYTFKHALLQDAAYASLLRVNRQGLHGRIAEALRTQLPDIATTQPELLARHYTEAGQTERAIEWWQKAGDVAIRRSADVEATLHLGRAIDLLGTLPAGPERDARELYLRADLSGSLFATQGYSSADAEANSNRAWELCERVDGGAKLFQVLWGRFTAHLVRADIPRATQEAERFHVLAERTGDPALIGMALRNLGIVKLHGGDLRVAQVHLEQAMGLIDPGRREDFTFAYGLDPLTTALSALCLLQQQIGALDRAAATAREALQAGRNANHFASMAYALLRVGLHAMLRGDAATVDVLGNELLSSATRRNGRTWGRYGEILCGWHLAANGNVGAGIELMDRGIDGVHAANGQLFIPMFRFEQAMFLERDGRFAEALDRLDAAQALIEPGGQRMAEAELYRLRAAIALAADENGATAEALFTRALSTARRQGALFCALRAATSLASLYHARGRDSDAQQILAPVYAEYGEGWETTDVRVAKALLDELAP